MSVRAVSHGSAGFTLIEALISVLLMGIILGALGTVTAQWLPGWDRGVARLQRIDTLAVGIDRLAGDIAAAEIVSTGNDKTPPLFDGDVLSVTLVRTVLNPNTAGGLEVVRIAETSDDHGPALVRASAPFTPNMPASAGTILFANAVPVIRGPYDVAFSYAGPDRVWRDTWHQQITLPRAIRVRLLDRATSTTLAVSTATLVHAEVPANCIWAANAAPCLASKGADPTAANSRVKGFQ